MKLLAIGAVALASLLASTALPGVASAQTAGPQNPGPVIPGVCVYFNQRLMAQSLAGQAMAAKLQALENDVRGELAPYATSIQTEAALLQQGGAAADPDGSRRTALQARAQEAQDLQRVRTGELRYTSDFESQAIAAVVEPILVALYQEKGCGIMLNRSGVFLLNPAMEVTDTVIERLNAAMPTLDFQRLPVPPELQDQYY